MGEAILVKAGNGLKKDPLEDIPVSSGICSLLVAVRDSDGGAVRNTLVSCKDGSTWYNYHTNDQGYALFSTNSGAANVIAYNYSLADNFNIVDQYTSDVYNVDAPTSTKQLLTINLKPLSQNKLTFSSNVNNIKFQVAKNPYVQILGGGGGGSGHFNICLNRVCNGAQEGMMYWFMSEYAIGGFGGGG